MDMAGAGVDYPSVFVVDRETLPPLPPKPGHMLSRTRRNQLIQKTLFLLVFIVLFGLAVEGYFIFDLYKKHPEPQSAQQSEAQKGEENNSKPVTSPLKHQRKDGRAISLIAPSKPLAHLTAVSKKAKEDGVMQWNLEADPILYDLTYKDGKVIVKKEGYYYVYSKICFRINSNFIHLVQKETPRYLNKPIELLIDRRHQQTSDKDSKESSYLGGVFYLYQKDAVFVHVNSNRSVFLQTSADNYFGMFMV